MLMYTCHECGDTVTRAKDWLNGIKKRLQCKDDTDRYEHYAWFCALKECGKKFIPKKGTKKITLLFKNGKKSKRIPGEQEWKGCSIYTIVEVTPEQENVFRMLKAITSVVSIQNALAHRNLDFDLRKFGIHDFGDLVDILGSDSLRQATKIVGKEGILWKQTIEPEEALKTAQGTYGGYPLLWANDGSGYCGHVKNIPVLKDKPEETLTNDDVQIIVELMISTIGIEGYRNSLLQETTQRQIMEKWSDDTQQPCDWNKFSKGQNQTGKLFRKILWQMEDNNLKELVERVREQIERRGEMHDDVEAAKVLSGNVC